MMAGYAVSLVVAVVLLFIFRDKRPPEKSPEPPKSEIDPKIINLAEARQKRAA